MSVNHKSWMIQTNILLKNQITYYKARASEYDEWFLRLGRYNQGKIKNQQWFSEVAQLQKALKQFNPKGTVLELACGTGWWTEQLLQYADHITAIDAGKETIAINKHKVGTDKVTFITADIFSWQPKTRYDVVFFSFWLSHVPEQKFEDFWKLVRQALKPHGRVFFIDSLQSEKHNKTFTINNLKDNSSIRKLNDGRTFKIVKLFYDPKTLEPQLKKMGWDITVKQTQKYFLYGLVTLRK